MTPKQKNPLIDIPLDGVGSSTANPAPLPGTSPIDIPLETPAPAAPHLGAGSITDAELEIVNRHHAEIKELHRRAREQNG